MARDGFHIIDCHHHVGLVPSLMAAAADAGPVRFVPDTAWASDEAMEQMLATGMEAGMTASVGQIDALLDLSAQA